MEQKHRSQNGQKNTKNQHRIWNVSYTAIAIWCWLIAVFFVQLWVYDRVPDVYKAQVFVESILTLAIVAVIVVHAVMYYKQAKETNRQANLMQESLKESIKTRELENRAYITTTGVNGDRPLEAGQGQTIKIGLNNSGKTPAINVVTRYSVNIANKRPILPDFPATPFRSKRYVANGDSTFISMRIEPLRADLFQMYLSGEVRCWIIGVVDYDDIFNTHHQTHFCYFQMAQRAEILSCEEGNVMD